MARPISVEPPSYRLHRPTGLAVVRLSGRDVYLGKHGSHESHQVYQRLVAEWLANGKQLRSRPMETVPASSFTVNELILVYLEFSRGYYVRPDGTMTDEVGNIKDALRPLTLLYGDVAVTAFTPSALKAVRQAMIEADLSRSVVNSRVNRIRRMMKWGVESELVPATVLHALQAIAPLKRGRSEARETEPVRPVPDELIQPVLRCVSPQFVR